MPIYEYECARCGSRFEELTASGAAAPACATCGSPETKRLFSPVSPPDRRLRGAKKRDSDLRRSEREAARRERISEAQKSRRGTGS